MLQTSRLLCLALLTSGLAAGGYAYQHGQASQEVRLGYIRALANQLAANDEQRAAANAATGRSIAHYVCLNRNHAADVAVLTQTQQIQARTRGLIDTLNLLRQHLQSAATNDDLVDTLPAHVDRYATFIRHYIPEATSNKQILVSRHRLETTEFGELPLPAAQAAFTMLEAQLRCYEAWALQTQAEKVGDNYDGFDRILPLAVPTTETVAPGGTYQAQLFLAQSGHRDLCNMEMTANGVPLTQPNGPGMQVQVAVPTARPGQSDTVRAQWHGTIRGPLFPRDTVLQLDVPYLIVQPRTP